MMYDKLSIEERIRLHAQNGKTNIYLRLWKKEAKKLEKEGFVLSLKVKSRKNLPSLYEIRWNEPIFTPSLAADMLKLSIEAIEKEEES